MPVLAGIFMYVMICILLGVMDAVFPIFSDFTILSIAIGIGCATTMFTLFNRRDV